MKIRIGLEGLGASILLLCPYYVAFLVSSNMGVYLLGLPVTRVIGGILVDLLCATILVSGFLFALRYLSKTMQRVLQALFAGIMLWIFVDVAVTVLGTEPYQGWWSYGRKQCGIGIVLVSVGLAYFLPRIVEPAVRVVRLGITAIAFTALWIIPQLVHLALTRQPDDTAASLHPVAFPTGNSNQRIVWILFDELSYDQTFEHPASNMELPNFDRLRSESVSFSKLNPVGFYTASVIPSLFLGHRIEQIRATVDGDLWYKDESQNRWLAYDSNATIFSLAQQNGWSAGVDGWYNPYCHILASVLNSCSWEPSSLLSAVPGASEEKSVLANAAVLPAVLLAKVLNRSEVRADAHIKEQRVVMARSHALIENGQLRFVFLHLPVPHPPGIYDRQRHLLRSGGTYLDNLVLADDTLGSLLQEIDATPSAKETTVIVSSDHSWRVSLWRPAGGWSAEEEHASGGHFDDRPVLLIHFPGQTSGSDVTAATPELLEHDIVAGMLLGKINNSDDLSAFLAQQSH